MGAADEGSGRACGCMCDAAASRVLDQTMVRYNDRSAYANNNQQDNQTLLLSMFQSQAQNALEQTPMTELAGSLAQLLSVVKHNFAGGA